MGAKKEWKANAWYWASFESGQIWTHISLCSEKRFWSQTILFMQKGELIGIEMASMLNICLCSYKEQ